MVMITIGHSWYAAYPHAKFPSSNQWFVSQCVRPHHAMCLVEQVTAMLNQSPTCSYCQFLLIKGNNPHDRQSLLLQVVYEVVISKARPPISEDETRWAAAMYLMYIRAFLSSNALVLYSHGCQSGVLRALFHCLPDCTLPAFPICTRCFPQLVVSCLVCNPEVTPTQGTLSC
jgi:hypothetical protein